MVAGAESGFCGMRERCWRLVFAGALKWWGERADRAVARAERAGVTLAGWGQARSGQPIESHSCCRS